jgi:cytochrome c peroxidase
MDPQDDPTDDKPCREGIQMRNRFKQFKSGSATLLYAPVIVGTALFVFSSASLAVQNAPAGGFDLSTPLGLPQHLWRELVPADNPMTADKIALGRKLFFDKRLSIDRTVSCATCHDPAKAFSDGNPVGIGFQDKKGARNSPTVLNSMFNELQFWDGRAPTLEEQAKLPLINPVEMGMENHPAVVTRVREIPEYQADFSRVFAREGLTIDTVVKAIAAFERTQLSGDSPFDRFISGDHNAISDSAKRGWDLYNGKARCISCHAFNTSSPFFTDFKFHNIGVAAKDQDFQSLARRARQLLMASPERAHQALDEMALSPGFSELGRYLVTKQPRDIGAFKTPTLREVELTGPYMHDGSEKTLLDVVKFYDDGGIANPNLDGGMRPLRLNDAEMDDLVALMKTFTSDDMSRTVRRTRPQTRDPQQ